MKKINVKVLFLFTIFLCLTACSSDDDSSNTNTAQVEEETDPEILILGKWNGITRINGNGEVTEYTNLCPTKKNYWEFKEDGSIKLVNHNEECVANTDTARWRISVGNLILSHGSQTIGTYNINEITSTKLSMDVELNFEVFTIIFEKE